MDQDCAGLTGRKYDICNGTSGLPQEIVEQYLALWAGQPVQPTKPQNLDCIYRGEQTDWIDCPTCTQKTVRLKVFGCQLHANCVMANDIGKIKGCIGCGSRVESDPERTVLAIP